jgi:hypothetical protein
VWGGPQPGVANQLGCKTEFAMSLPAPATQGANEDDFDVKAESVTVGFDYNFGSAMLAASAGYDHYGTTMASCPAVTSP